MFPTIHIKQGDNDLTSQAGLLILGRMIHVKTDLIQRIDDQFKDERGVGTSSSVLSMMGSMCLGNSGFNGVDRFDNKELTARSLGIKRMPSEATLRQRLDKRSDVLDRIVKEENFSYLKNIRHDFRTLSTGHVPVDVDVTVLDNSNSSKDGVEMTYKQCYGYAPLMTYIGQEGFCLDGELRPGSQHCQKGTPERLRECLQQARTMTSHPILMRMDSGNDAVENMALAEEMNSEEHEGGRIDFIVKWNPRSEKAGKWMEIAGTTGEWKEERPGKMVATISEVVGKRWAGIDYQFRRVVRVSRRTIDRKGQRLLLPLDEVEGWWTTLDIPADEVIRLYNDHGTSEQFHSELKTDMNMERLPSGKFATNTLILSMAVLVFNILRYVGLDGLHKEQEALKVRMDRANGGKGPKNPDKNNPSGIPSRRRIRTVIDQLMHITCRIVRSSRRVVCTFGKNSPMFPIFQHIYDTILVSQHAAP